MAGQSAFCTKKEAEALAKGAGTQLGKAPASGSSGHETQLGEPSGSYNKKK